MAEVTELRVVIYRRSKQLNDELDSGRIAPWPNQAMSHLAMPPTDMFIGHRVPIAFNWTAPKLDSAKCLFGDGRYDVLS